VVAHALGPLGMTRILAIVSPANAASIGLLGKIGLVYVRTILPPGERTTVNLYSSDGTAPEPVSVRGSGAA
jgi:RimJ/RimL family protein N-acetyltransferase